MTLFIVSVSLALLISAMCSLMEATLLSLTPSQVADLVHRQPKMGAIWQRFKANLQPPIAAILLLNTAAHTIGASVAGSQFDDLYGDEWILAFSLVFTFVMLQFTEILPKTLGVRYNREVAHFIARPLNAMVVGLTPLLRCDSLDQPPLRGPPGATRSMRQPLRKSPPWRDWRGFRIKSACTRSGSFGELHGYRNCRSSRS